MPKILFCKWWHEKTLVKISEIKKAGNYVQVDC